jgi:hypothetical protein
MAAVAVDTHAIVWYLANDTQLWSKAADATDLAAAAGDGIHVPSNCMVELTYLVEKGRLPSVARERLVREIQYVPPEWKCRQRVNNLRNWRHTRWYFTVFLTTAIKPWAQCPPRQPLKCSWRKAHERGVGEPENPALPSRPYHANFQILRLPHQRPVLRLIPGPHQINQIRRQPLLLLRR